MEQEEKKITDQVQEEQKKSDGKQREAGLFSRLFQECKKIGFIRILLILILVALCIYVRLPGSNMVAEASQEGVVSEENVGNLGRGSRARQRIYFKKNVTLYSVDLRFDLQDGKANTEWLTVYIRDKKTQQELTHKRVYTKNMKDGEMTRVRFPEPVELTQNHSYLVIVTGPELKKGETSPSVRLSSFSTPSKTLYVGGSLVKNQQLDAVYNYTYDDSFNRLGYFIAGILMLMILVVPRWFWRRLGQIKGVGWALFCFNPIAVFTLTLYFFELQNGRMPMTIVFNCWLLFFAQSILYAVIGNKYVTLLFFDACCFLFTVATLQVNTFKGVPILPSDFLFIRTAFEVVNHYKIEWTHTQIQYMIFMFVYLVFVFEMGSYKSQKRGIFAMVLRGIRTLKAKKQVAQIDETEEEEKAQQDPAGQEVAAAAVEMSEEGPQDIKDSKNHAWMEKCRRFFDSDVTYCISKTVFRIALCIVGVMGIANLYTTDVLAQNGISVFVWNRSKSFKQNGVYLEFMMNFHYVKLQVPEGYSEEQVKTLMTDYKHNGGTDGANAKTGGDKPNVIMIMNESLSDYQLFDPTGERVTYNKDYFPYIHSLKDNVIKGKCYVSVFGNMTANSEFECLTSNSMAFLPVTSVPYQQFIKGTTFALPGYMETLGYKTKAIHPCAGSNWNRINAYNSMGFDEFITQDGFTNPEYVRYISDDETFRKIEEQFKKKKDSDKLFVMGVTMQNHGGYDTDTDWEDPIVADDGSYNLANEYFSSIHVSDQAFKHLINYFKDYKEPTIIMMFGDHQPSIEEEFIAKALGVENGNYTFEQNQDRYCTPYVIWANYDIDANVDETTSANFLTNMVLNEAGLELPDYNKFIEDIRKDVQAMNAYGFMTKDGTWHTYDEDSEIAKRLKDYAIVEYGYFGEKDEKTMSNIFEMPLEVEE